MYLHTHYNDISMTVFCVYSVVEILSGVYGFDVIRSFFWRFKDVDVSDAGGSFFVVSMVNVPVVGIIMLDDDVC
jgi:hypothetical protein